MNIIKTPEWYKTFITDAKDVTFIKNKIIFLYEELIEKLLLLKDVQINELNCDELFEKSYQLIEDYQRNLEKNFSVLSIYNHLGNDIKLKQDIQKVFNDINIFLIQNFTYNLDIYAILFSIGNFLLQKDLKKNKRILIEDTLNEYKRLGIDLSEEKKNRLKEIDVMLTDICIDFEMNIQANKNHIIVKQKELTGLTEVQIERLQKMENNEYKIGIDYPTYAMIMSYCTNSIVRKKLYKEFNTRAYPENVEILSKIRILKDEKAKILGYANYPEFDFENQMSKNIIQVKNLLCNINNATLEKAKIEKKILTNFAQKEVFKDSEYTVIYPWDVAYVSQLYENKYFNIDQEKVSEYFPITHTINKLLEIYCAFFDIDMKIIEYDDNSWKFDSSIKVIRIFKKNGDIIGDLILDLYPRENKYSHACFSDMISAVLKKGSDTELIEMPIGLIIANFNKPTQLHDGLLKYSEVRTFFHEFGHALHGLFGATEFYSQSGTRVHADFVETPSQLFEQWLLQENLIKNISSHYKTHEPLPSEMIKKIIDIEFYDMGLFFQRQINLSALALELFLQPNKSVDIIIDELSSQTIRLSYVDSLSQSVYSFGHLASGLYGPKYYAYLWSLVYAIDFFNFIKMQNGLLDPQIGIRLKEDVLAKGGSEDPFILLEDFLHRKSNMDNFYNYLNTYQLI